MADNNIKQWTDTSRVETADLQRWEDGANKADCLEKQIPEMIAAHNDSDEAHGGIRAIVNEAQLIAQKKTCTIIFETKSHLDSWIDGNSKNMCPLPDEIDHLLEKLTVNNDGTFNYRYTGGSYDMRPLIYVTLPPAKYTLSTNFITKAVLPNRVKIYYADDPDIDPVPVNIDSDDGSSQTFTASEKHRFVIYFGINPKSFSSVISMENIQVQIEEGDTATDFVPSAYNKDGITKSDLKAGDLLLVDETGVPDGYWDGSAFVEMEAQSAQKADQTYSPTSENAQSGTAVSEAVSIEKKRADSTFSNALKGSKSGSAILVDDVSPVTHTMSVKVSSDTVTDLTAVKVVKCGKNLFDKNMPFDDSTKATECNWTAYFIQLQPNTTYYCTVFNPQSRYRIMLLSSSTNINGSTSKSLAISHDYGESGFATWGTQKALTTGQSGKLYIGTFLEPAKVAECIQKCNLQIELGNTGTEYEPYITPTEYTPNADGTVDGVTSLYPTTMLSVNADYIPVHIKPSDWETNYTDYYEYHSDTGKYSKLSMQTENTKSIMQVSSGVNYIGGIYVIESVVRDDPMDGLASIYFSEYDGDAPMVSNEDADTFEVGQYVYFEFTDDSSTDALTGSISTLVIPEFVADMYYSEYKGDIIIDCEYNRDINKAFAELQKAIISLGGNV